VGSRRLTLAALVLLAAPACGAAEEDVSSIRVSRGSPDVDRWLDLTVTGTGFGVVEGMSVVLQVGRPEQRSQRLGWAETAVLGGAFTLHLPEVLEPAVETRKVLWIDGNGDALCDGFDLVYADDTFALDDATIELTRYREGPGFAFSSCDDVVAEWPAD
jgi:hypothetical protein